jgi:hypothetical protein
MGETEMENEIRQEVFGNWRTVFTREGYQSSVICGVCGNDKSKTKRNKKGKQFVKQPKGIAKKTAKYRRYS